MDLPITQLTYHSRRRDNEAYPTYGGVSYSLKQKQTLKQQQQLGNISPFSLNRASYLSSMQPVQIPSFSYIPSQRHQQSTQPKEELYNKNPKQGSSYQLQLQRQKTRTLSQHLKCALQSNTQMQGRYNVMKSKLEEKQVKHMNQMSVLKAELIILRKQFLQKDQGIRGKDLVIGELKSQIARLSQINKTINEKCQNTTTQLNQMKNLFITKTVNDNQQLLQLQKLLSTKDTQIQKLAQQLNNNQASITQKQSNQKQHQRQARELQSRIQELQPQLSRLQKSYQQILTQNSQLKEQNQLQRDRINQLNQHMTEICHNSEHLFQQIRDSKMQKDVLNKKLDDKEHQIIQQEKTIKQFKERIKIFQAKCEQQRIGHDIVEQKYRQVCEKHDKVQEENLNLSKTNSSLLEEIEILDLEVTELKEMYLAQQRKQQELINIIAEMQQETLIKQQRANVPTRERTYQQFISRQQRPTTDLDRRVKTQLTDSSSAPYFNCPLDNYQPKTHNSTLPNQPRFNYLHDIQQHQRAQTIPPKDTYSQFLSFQPSKPYSNVLTSKELYNPKRRVSTCIDQRQSSYQQIPLTKNYDLPCQSMAQKDKDERRSRSFYIQRKNDLVAEQNHQVYKSVLDSKNYQKQRNSFTSMRFSLDLRQKSLEPRKNTHNLQKQPSYPVKNNLIQRIYTQNQPQDSNEAKNMFLSKLDKMKLWAKQTVSQNNTQREALKQLPSNDDFLKSKDIPINTIIKQKSNILNQRKNLLTFNLNNQMIQKNILKLQQNTNASSRGMLRQKEQSGSMHVLRANNIETLSPIYEELRNGIKNTTNIKSSVVNNCKKLLYNQ